MCEQSYRRTEDASTVLAESLFLPDGNASTIFAVVLWWSDRLYLCLSYCMSHASTVPKQLNLGSRKQHCAIALGVLFFDTKIC